MNPELYAKLTDLLGPYAANSILKTKLLVYRMLYDKFGDLLDEVITSGVTHNPSLLDDLHVIADQLVEETLKDYVDVTNKADGDPDAKIHPEEGAGTIKLEQRILEYLRQQIAGKGAILKVRGSDPGRWN